MLNRFLTIVTPTHHWYVSALCVGVNELLYPNRPKQNICYWDQIPLALLSLHWSEAVCCDTLTGVRPDGPPQRLHDPHAPRSQLWHLQVPLQLELPQLSEHPEGRVPPGPVQEVRLGCSQVPHGPEEHVRTRTAESQRVLVQSQLLSSRSSDMYWHDAAPRTVPAPSANMMVKLYSPFKHWWAPVFKFSSRPHLKVTKDEMQRGKLKDGLSADSLDAEFIGQSRILMRQSFKEGKYKRILTICSDNQFFPEDIVCMEIWMFYWTTLMMEQV